MRVPEGSSEPVVESWAEVDVAELLGHLGLEPGGPGTRVLAIDGRSGAGKSTTAARLARLVPGSAVVATDDIAWNLAMFDWTRELITHVVEPVRAGQSVAYRPPGWVAHDRPGAVRVEPARSLLIIEGVGSAQRAMSAVLDAAVWVQSDRDAARAAGLARDVASGVNGDPAGAAAFWDQWEAEELPFLERERPWERAGAILAGVPLGSPDRLLWRPAARPGLAPPPPPGLDPRTFVVGDAVFVVTRVPGSSGGYQADWTNHPDGYGFGWSGPGPLDDEAITAQLRDFLDQIDPETGFLRD